MLAVESLVRACRRRPIPLPVSELASRQQNRGRRKFQSPDYLLQEAMFLVERRISLFWIVRGQTRMSTSLQSLPGPGSENRRWSTIGFDGWLLNIIVLQS